MTEREQFEAWVSASGRGHLLERDYPFDGYADLTVTAWWTAWQASRAALIDQPVTLTDSECEQIANIMNMNRKSFRRRA